MEELLVESFPPEEYRELEHLREYTDRIGNFHNNIIFDDDLPIGFITYWDFDEFYYVEHFATNPALRNGGYGKRTLEHLCEFVKRPIVLEVERPVEEPGEFILQKYCKRETRAKYRYGVSYAQFLGKCQETVLNDRYVWVSDIPDEKVTKWLDFVSEYQKNVQDKTPGIFILEVHNDAMNRKSKKGIRSLGFEQNIGAYDKYAFCALASSETNCKEFLRPYLAEAVASVCGDDVELCAVCVAKGMEFLNAPYETIQKVTEELVRSDGERYCFSKSQEEVDTLLWEAQLKYVFPLVENYRRYFVKKYYDFIKAALPINNGYGDQVMVPEEAELGNLMYLVERGGIPVSAEESMELKRYRKEIGRASCRERV